MPFIHDEGYDWPYDVYDSSDDDYYESTMEVIPQEDPFDRNRRLINIDLGPAVSAAAEAGREIRIIVEEPVEGDESVAVPWELLDGWFYSVGNSYVISLVVEDKPDFDPDAVYLYYFYNTGRSFSFLFTIDPLLIRLLD
ncbi:hypothetical protein T069G_02473 [Trichoderma breve]|uniref:Uncharacterized protein n=1 Tax=Trichoderma breve TaxID=2034170 RepID=A0A9W9BHM0_9HYPO|nr:hypothetical protein T069G_02473 [Trichoderma breve]KAJ4861519.1 hypothetical protein T069G_02473 [Trichoderma breve]